MGIDRTFAKAYAKAAIAAGQKLPSTGNVFITMIDKYKDDIAPIAKELTVRTCAQPLTTYALHHDELRGSASIMTYFHVRV